ncbi:hypothetical protein JL107_15680 [Nakamurella flavida]|uniref:Carbohydrate kinase PfkB domain-containing protein n=1 Tax=Nakamurella flavida TaxID=363630 RepID=A0A938YNC2_9ACTN|nr:PfkB family carbohydrate kinase [Nakamurella flavida]MBM9477888.1 hypothetical protein [Nakamurella flavida]MDP9778398.1 2-dehydro-3-deoxygluconokinase [Nakamurella flavida]
MTSFDVIVLGEVLLEVATTEPMRAGAYARLGVSGDALNVAAAAAATGARVGLLAVLPPDWLGDAVEARVAELGVDTRLLRRRPGQQGVYVVHSDPDGQREFSYARSQSVGSTLSPADLVGTGLETAGAVVTGGIAAAISESARAAVIQAASTARQFVFDPNFRPALTRPAAAAAVLAAVAPHAALLTPSHPRETTALLGIDRPFHAAQYLLGLGAKRIAVTCGSAGALLAEPGWAAELAPFSAPAVVDQTGAGDSFVGSLTARLVAGEDFLGAARYAAAAAALSVGGQGGTGYVPRAQDVQAAMNAAATA